MKYFYKLFSTALVITVTACVQADDKTEWASIDGVNSSVSFVSVKNKDIAEAHTFDNVSGSISESGNVQITIDATSVNTGIGIRNDRMKEHLFAAAMHPNILISAQVDLDSIEYGAQRMRLPASLSLLGQQHDIELDVLVTKHKTEITVSSAKPVLIYAAQVGLTEGVARLAELAGGISIGNTVPVSFALSFKR